MRSLKNAPMGAQAKMETAAPEMEERFPHCAPSIRENADHDGFFHGFLDLVHTILIPHFREKLRLEAENQNSTNGVWKHDDYVVLLSSCGIAKLFQFVTFCRD